MEYITFEKISDWRGKKMKDITEITGNSEYWLYIWLYYLRNINFVEHDNGIMS